MKLELVYYPNKILTTPCQDVVFPVSPKIAKLATSMFIKMKEWEGIGLSAPQVGRSLNIITIDTSHVSNGKKLIMFNPKVIKYSEEFVTKIEGCLSFPGQIKYQHRPKEITVEWCDLSGLKKTGVFSGLTAQVIMHECDHLQGNVFTDETVNTCLYSASNGGPQNL